MIEVLVKGRRLKIETGMKGVGQKVWILRLVGVDLGQRVIDRAGGFDLG